MQILAKAFLTRDDCLSFIAQVAIGEVGMQNEVSVFLITARDSLTLEHAYSYLQESLPHFGIEDNNMHLLELRDVDLAERQMRKLKEEISANPSPKRVILGKGFHDLCSDLLAVDRDDYTAMVILRELWPKDVAGRFYSMAGESGVAPGFHGLFVDLESAAHDLTTDEYERLKAAIERKPRGELFALVGDDGGVGEMLMGIGEKMMEEKDRGYAAQAQNTFRQGGRLTP